MLLDIIVPHYNEPWEVGKKLFDMLAMQRAVDFDQFRVLLVNDGEENSITWRVRKEKYPFDTVGITIPHGGVSAARNRGMEWSTAKWVMFCDFDDTFTNVYSLRSYMDVLGDEAHDLLWTPFYVEINAEKERQVKNFNLIFIHGKLYRLDFLKERDIRFNEDLRYSEDTAFNQVVSMEIDQKRIGKIETDIVPYVWTYREDSVTTDPKNTFKNGVGLFHRQQYVAEEHLKRGNKEAHDALCVRALCDAYITLFREDLKDCDRSGFTGAVETFYQEKKDSAAVSMETLTEAFTAAVKESGVRAEQLPKDMTFSGWLKELRERGR